MYVHEILTEVDLLVDNSLSSTHKIRYINQIQRQLFRDYRMKTSADFGVTVPGTALYELPSDCQEDNLLEVSVGGNRYDEAGSDERAAGNVYTVVNHALLLQPTPTGEEEIYLYYYARPTELTESDMEAKPELSEDYHDLLIIGCAEKVALAMKDHAIAKELTARYGMLLREALVKLSPKIKKVRIKRGWM
jgi:hypothetical protein